MEGNVGLHAFLRVFLDRPFPAKKNLGKNPFAFRPGCGLDCGFVTAPSYDYSKPTCDNYCEDVGGRAETGSRGQ